jgi:hypothetical protein
MPLAPLPSGVTPSAPAPMTFPLMETDSVGLLMKIPLERFPLMTLFAMVDGPRKACRFTTMPRSLGTACIPPESVPM